MAYRHSKPMADGSMDVRVTGRYARLLLDADDPNHIGVDDLDIEELAKCQLKDKNGKFTGRPPKFLPRPLVDAMRNEHYKRINSLLEESLSDQVKTMIAISKDICVEPAVRLKAAIYVYERFMGKIPDRVEVKPGKQSVDDIVDDILFEVEENQKTGIEKELELAKEELEREPTSRRRTRTAMERMQQRRK